MNVNDKSKAIIEEETKEHHEVDLQTTVANKLTQATKDISIGVIQLFAGALKMNFNTFLTTHITPKQLEINQLDSRTKKVFDKIVGAVNEQLNKDQKLVQGFKIFAFVSKDAEIKNKVVGSIALPHVLSLIQDLDKIKPSIVEDIGG